MAAPSLTVCRLDTRVETPRRAAEALAARSLAQAVLEGPFASALGAAAAGLLSRADAGLVVINHLEVDVSQVPGETAEEAARRWAATIVGKLARELRAPGITFATPAEHLAFFLQAALEGRPNGAALRPFAGFAAMPVGIAIRAALTSPQAPRRAALRLLAPRLRLAVLERMSIEDARQVLLALAAPEDRLLALSVEPTALDTATGAANQVVAAIWLTLEAPSHRGETLRVPLQVAEQFAVSLKTLAERGTSQHLSHRPPVTASAPRAGSPLETAMQGAKELPKPLRKALQRRLAQESKTGSRHYRSPVAGLAMLLPDLLQLATDLPARPESLAAARLRMDILAAAAAEQSAGSGDPILRLLAGLSPDQPLPPANPDLTAQLCEIAGAEEAAPDALASLLLRRFAARIRGFEDASHSYLLDNFLATPGTADIERDRLRIRYAPPPILIALSMAGCDRGRLSLPWDTARVLDFGPEGGV